MRWWRRGLAVGGMLVALWPGLGHGQTSTSFTFHAGATSVTNGAVLPASNFSTIVVQVEGTFVGTVQFEKKTKNATGYVAVQCTNATDRTQIATSTEVPGYWECPGGAYSFRVPVTARTSGTIVVTGMGTTAVAGRGSGGGSAQGLDANFDLQPKIDGATTAKPFEVGNGIQALEGIGDPTLGAFWRPKPLGDTPWYIWPNFEGCAKDVENSYSNIFCINPDAFSTGSGTFTMMTGEQFVASNLGIEFNESDTNPACAAGNYNIYADTSETKLKKCQNGTVSDLDATGSATIGLVRKTADESVTSSTVMQSDDQLVVALDANSYYAIRAVITYDSPAAGDFKFQFTVPSGATGRKFALYSAVNATSCASTAQNSWGDAIGDAVTGIGAPAAGAPCDVVIDGYVITSGTSGNLTLQWAQDTSDATATTVKAGSFIQWHKS